VNRPLRTLAVVLAVIVFIASLDQILARTEVREVQNAATRSWTTGMRLLHNGQPAEALDALRDAHAMERDNVVYELDMISALTALGRTSDADPLIDEVLQRRPNDGYANLIAARVKAREGDAENAEAFYHRAIYAEWPPDGSSSFSTSSAETRSSSCWRS
jgi:Tfp pilus assembly protein PilF